MQLRCELRCCLLFSSRRRHTRCALATGVQTCASDLATDAVALRRELQRLAPAAADVEHAHPLAQPELAADQVELGFLRIIEVLRLAPVAAAVDQALAEHGAVEVVAQVVVALADLVTASSGLQVEQARTQCGADVGGSSTEHPSKLQSLMRIAYAL